MIFYFFTIVTINKEITWSISFLPKVWIMEEIVETRPHLDLGFKVVWRFLGRWVCRSSHLSRHNMLIVEKVGIYHDKTRITPSWCHAININIAQSSKWFEDWRKQKKNMGNLMWIFRYTHVEGNSCMGIMESLLSTNAAVGVGVEVQIA